LVKHTKAGKRYHNDHKNKPDDNKCVPNGHKIYHLVVNTPNGLKIYHHLSVQDTTKFTRILIFGLKMCMPSGNPGAEGENECFRF
jgi:hypothetical protein